MSIVAVIRQERRRRGRLFPGGNGGKASTASGNAMLATMDPREI